MNRKDINKKKQEKMIWKKSIQNNDSLPSRGPVKKKHNQGILHISMDVCLKARQIEFGGRIIRVI